MINKSKMKVYVFILGLMLAVGQAFAAADCLETATIWKDCVSMPGDTTINDTVYKKITTEKELAWLSNNIGNNAILLNDLDMGGKLWIPIAAGDGSGTRKYGKVFDGNHHRISNLYVNAEELLKLDSTYAQNLGFIGCLTGTVKHLIIENISIYGYGSGFLKDKVDTEAKPLSIGTVVGWQSNLKGANYTSLVDGCYVTGKIITSGDGQAVGGVVGNIGGGTLKNCVSYATIDANGKAYVGGIVGYTKSYENGKDSVSSCVYAGNSLSSTGSGTVGGIVGYQYKGDVAISAVVYDSDLSVDGEPVNGFGATKEGKVNGKQKPNLDYLNAQTTPVENLNAEAIVCALNGKNEDGTCKTEPWEKGETSLSLNGYGADGYKVTFDANGGSIAGGLTFVKYVKAGNTINNDGVADPTWTNSDYVFAGWSGDAYNNAATKATTITATWNPMHTITFSPVNGDLHGTFPNGSSDPISIKIEDGKRIVVQGFTRPTSFIDAQNVKYNFMGWADGNDPTVLYVDENGLDNLPVATENMTLVAAWTTAPVYTVRFYENESSTASYVSSVYENEKANELTTDKMDPHPGYTFEGWFERGASTSFNFNQTITKDVNLYAKWTKNSYTVNYVLDCSNECTNPNGNTFTVEGKPLSDPVWDEKHHFLGWYADAEFKDKKTSIPAGLTNGITLYAEWELITYDITYRAGTYGTGFVAAEKKTHNEEYTLRGASYTRNGYIQGGWSTKDDGSDFLAFNSKYVENADLILYPYWTLQTFTVTYDRGDYGVGDIAPATRAYGANLLLSTEVFTRDDGYVQNGWIYTTNDATIEYDLGAAFDVDADVTLIPRWVPAYTVTYNAGEFGEGAVAAGIKTQGVDFELSSETFTRTNYTQDGWMITENGDAVDYALGAAYTENADITLYPHWVIKTYTAEYDLNGGSMDGNASFTFTIESDELPLATPNERQGFSFAGWRDSKTGEVLTDAFPANSSGDRTLTAQWSLLPITVTAGSGTFEYDGKIHNAECSYEGTLPIGFSIEMDPSGSVHKVADGDVTTTCAVAIKDEFNNDVTNQFTELTIVDGSISVVAKAVPYGAVTIYTDETGNSAVIEGEYTDEGAIEINDNIEVKDVILNREFATGSLVYSTIMFPFSIETKKVSGGKFYGFNDVEGNDVHLKSVGDILEANTPYIVEASAERLTFDLKGEPVIFNTTVKNAKKSSNGIWEFIGTYEFRTWKADDDDIGRVYGFASKTSSDPNSIGKFRMGRVGTTIKPLRAYMLYTPTQAKSRALAKSLFMNSPVQQIGAPVELNVVIDGDDGETTVIGKLNPATGEIKIIDNWYDMKGRKLNAKPTAKGIYYFNGKRVIVR